MTKFPFPMTPTSASLTGAVLAASVLILGLDVLEIQLWWLELLRDIDRATDWTGFTSPNDWVYLFENRKYAAFHKVNSYLLLATLLFVVSTVTSWCLLLVRMNVTKGLHEICQMIDFIKAHYADLKHHVPNLNQQAGSALGKTNGAVSGLATLERWIEKVTAEPPSSPQPQAQPQDTGSVSHDLVRRQEKELEPAPKRKLEEKEKEKKNDIDLEFDR